jgi:hypothetical protein
MSQTSASPKGFQRKKKYVGYNISVASQSYILSSNIQKLDGLLVSREGASTGIIVGNDIGVLKATIGLYYSGPSVPYSFDVLEAGLSGNIYLLRLKTPTVHLIEPYGSLSVKNLRSSFFGNYLNEEKNHLAYDEQLIGRIYTCQALIGVGAEYQLENDALNFIHFFAELKYGTSLSNCTSKSELQETRARNPMVFAVGMNFGNIK